MPVSVSKDYTSDINGKTKQESREECRKYLEQHHALDFVTKVLMFADETSGQGSSIPIPFLEAVQMDQFNPKQTEIKLLQRDLADTDRKCDRLTGEIKKLEEQVKTLRIRDSKTRKS